MQNVFLTIIILLFTITPSAKVNKYKPVTVLELFTSQGCSSCPPADNLLDKVKKEHAGQVIVLSYHVDYWNYIGWKDPFSKKAFSDKQRRYGQKFYSSSIYTPQIVINGKEHFVGSKTSVMNTKLRQYANKYAENEIQLNGVKKEAGSVKFNYGINGNIKHKRLKVALVIDSKKTHVKRGENSNRVLLNSNIVVEEVFVELNQTAGEVVIKIPEIVERDDKLSIVALVENKRLDIVGGSQIYL
ncbi:DUF1223 domain-containing protein [Seonamhaeicola marinus]|uniref:DUF1223 domain-containing protein n=1 Tax=Seonamhaeicola marinus TaxID=1912246 RepID=A0A5D0I4J3_9FLAO|nr:DUF1223 domain-containing protein [Seonamhaeicola marinus]TYA78635.1 DUF1223 domain-containing protein [Seonamhaeicola marinus]